MIPLGLALNPARSRSGNPSLTLGGEDLYANGVTYRSPVLFAVSELPWVTMTREAIYAEGVTHASEAFVLRQIFPNGRLSPPATEDEIIAVETMLGVRLPDQLRRLYFICDGFREDRGNAKYLFSLIEQDFIGSLVSMTEFMWTEFKIPDFRPFVFFGSSSGDEYWGINIHRPNEIIAYHHHMEDEYEVVATDIIEVYRADYARYEESE